MELALERKNSTSYCKTGEKTRREKKGTLLFEWKVDGEAIIWQKGAWDVTGPRGKLT